jgi:hypothetical protein
LGGVKVVHFSFLAAAVSARRYTFLDFTGNSLLKLNQIQVLELARCDWIERRENVISLGPSGTEPPRLARRAFRSTRHAALAISCI